MRLVSLLVCILAVPATSAQDPTCGPDARALATALRTDYGGRDLMDDADRAAAFDALVAQAGGAADAAACDSLLWTATALFPDGHLDVDTPREVPRRFWPDRRYGPWGGDLGLRFVGDSAAVLRIPSFDIDNKATVDSLLDAHRERLRRTPYLVINLQANGGGSDDTFSGLTPLLYTRPIRLAGADILATPGNRAYYAQYMDDERFDADTRAMLRDIVATIDAAEPGTFVAMGADEAFDTVLDGPTAMPRAVAVVVEGGVGSSAEEFTLMARTSDKVVVVGTPTAGALDYSNLRMVPLPSGERVLRLPTSRRAWLPGFSVDAAGIAPDVGVPPGVADWDAFALGVLAARDAVVLENRDAAERE